MINWSITQLPRSGTYPRTLFFYRIGKHEAEYKFTKQSATTHWVGHGFYSMSRKAVEQWVEAGAPKPKERPKKPEQVQLDILKAKVAECRVRGLSKLYVTPAQLDVIILLAEKAINNA